MKKLLMVLLAVLLLSACSEKGPVVEGFVGRNVEDVYAWCSEIDPKYSCEVSYGGNDEYEKDIVYEQSINAGKRLEDKIHIPFHIADDPLHSVAKGAGIALKNVERFSFLMR